MWACRYCIDRLGLDVAGQASSDEKVNVCAAGKHTVQARVWWSVTKQKSK